MKPLFYFFRNLKSKTVENVQIVKEFQSNTIKEANTIGNIEFY